VIFLFLEIKIKKSICQLRVVTLYKVKIKQNPKQTFREGKLLEFAMFQSKIKPSLHPLKYPYAF